MSCVHCGRPKDRHTPETLVCPGSSREVFSTRELPPGRTCADCAHFKRTCQRLIGYAGTETSCEWWPVRFYAIQEYPA